MTQKKKTTKKKIAKKNNTKNTNRFVVIDKVDNQILFFSKLEDALKEIEIAAEDYNLENLDAVYRHLLLMQENNLGGMDPISYCARNGFKITKD